MSSCLKFIAFGRSVLYLIPVPGVAGKTLALPAPRSYYREGWATERFKPKSHALSLKPERTATSQSFPPCVLPVQSLASGAASPWVVKGVFVNMAFSLNVLLGGRVCAAVARCGFATRGVTIPGSTSREPDPDFDWEPEERELQEVESALKRQKKAIRFQKIRRQMEASGAPPRTLTWEAMEQIRYLHREFSESWSVPRLAEGFDVSTDVIRRVLKSKFIPTLEQKLKQDQKVLKKIGLARSIPELPGPGDSSKPLSAGQSVSGSLLIPGDEASSRGHGHSTALKAIELNTQSTNITTRQTERNKGVQGLEEGKDFVPVAAGHPTSTCRGARGIDSNGLPSDKRLEELKAGEAGDQIFSKRVVQRGREFFDSNGNFLYRI